MGNKFIDKYTYTHFVVGSLLYNVFLFKISFMIHSIYKLIENMELTNKYLKNKYLKNKYLKNKYLKNKYLKNKYSIIKEYYDIETFDTIDNIIGDTFSFMFGCLSSYLLFSDFIFSKP